MSQPVKLSDALILEARLAAESEERSIAGQVEYWAKLGRSINELLQGVTQQRLVHRSKRPTLSDLVESVNTPAGQARLNTYLESRPFPHFAAHPTQKGLLVRTDADGHKSIGRFKNRQFVEITGAKPQQGTIQRVSRRKTAAARA